MAIARIVLNVEMLDGTQHLDVQTTVADQMAYARTRRTHKWDAPQDDPLTFVTFLAFAALRRTGAFTGGWDEFVAQAAAVAETERDEVCPTNPVPSND